MNNLLEFLTGGLLRLSWWQLIIVTLLLTHITIVAVTLYLHRSQAHRGLELHPAVAHFFRFWLWLTTGMVTKEWVAVHRKHHAKSDREGDPHSPMVYGIGKVLWRGAELYRNETAHKETMARFGHGTPDDWIERHLYARWSGLGLIIMLAVDVLLFGALGLTIWAVQMAWIPFWAAGVVNGVAHYIGYRNFASPDTSTNIFPIGILTGGEELHNNHHAYGTSAKFSQKWYEFDVGWLYIRLLSSLKLASIKRVAPKHKPNRTARGIGEATLEGVLTYRYELKRRYTLMMRRTARKELAKMRKTLSAVERRKLRAAYANVFKKRRIETEELISAPDGILLRSEVLAKLFAMRQELCNLWESSTKSRDQLLKELQNWTGRARRSGIIGLEEFARKLPAYSIS